MKYRLKVNQPNKVFVLRGKPTRTPFLIDNVTETELKVFKSKIKLEGISEDKYEIIPMEEVNKEEVKSETVHVMNKEEEEDIIKDEDDGEEDSNFTLDSYDE